jgi:hypothetical protein
LAQQVVGLTSDVGRGEDEEPAKFIGGEVAGVVAGVFDEGGVELALGDLSLKDLWERWNGMSK